MNDISVWSGLLLYGFAATATPTPTPPPPSPPSPPMVVEGRNATSDVQPSPGPVFHTHHAWRARHRR